MSRNKKWDGYYLSSFFSVVKCDRKYIHKKYDTDLNWRSLINHIVDTEFDCKFLCVLGNIDEQELFDILDGNGFQIIKEPYSDLAEWVRVKRIG